MWNMRIRVPEGRRLMTIYFSDEQTARLNDLIRKIERRTGVELVAAVVGKSDSYPEIPWKAFAFAAAAGALAYLALAAVRPDWGAAWGVRLSLVLVLGAGAAAAFLSVVWPSFGRLFLDRLSAETETGQYARVFFLEHELFHTRDRTAILLFISLYERKVVILPDRGVAVRLDQNVLYSVISLMAPHLRRKERFHALVQGLSALEAGLVEAGFKPLARDRDEIADELIQDKGADQ